MSVTHKSLNVLPRSATGNDVRKLRKTGVIPAVIYGFGLDKSINISLEYNAFEKLFRTAGSTSVLDLVVDGKKIPALVHSLQYHPVRDTYIHVDFLAVNLKTSIEAEVPLIFTGVPRPVKEDGAILNKALESIRVIALPDSIPHEITVDLSEIDSPDKVIKSADLKLPKGVNLADDTLIIASVSFASSEEPTSVEESTPVAESTNTTN